MMIVEDPAAPPAADDTDSKPKRRSIDPELKRVDEAFAVFESLTLASWQYALMVLAARYGEE